ncbi:MAG TPA: HAD hydrolase family protein, partial [Gemmataceae bacterium]|nr:HAD hydrolase family protein [Gemmataceae bacterium]
GLTEMLTLAQRCSPIELLVLDVDGVLTDGRISLAGADVEVKDFHVRDGSGMAVWRNAGKRTAIITGRNSPAVARRAAELRIEFVTQGSADKATALAAILAATGLRPNQAAAVGDDLPDVPVLRAVGLAIAVADACSEARQLAHYVTQNRGGHGGVREAIELIMHCQGIWPK